MAPICANVSMGKLEDHFVYTYPEQPLICVPYIDDIFCIWTGTRDNIWTLVISRSISPMKSRRKTWISWTHQSSSPMANSLLTGSFWVKGIWPRWPLTESYQILLSLTKSHRISRYIIKSCQVGQRLNMSTCQPVTHAIRLKHWSTCFLYIHDIIYRPVELLPMRQSWHIVRCVPIPSFIRYVDLLTCHLPHKVDTLLDLVL